jgi:hypothetical protein
MPGLLLLERGSPEAKLKKLFETEAASLQSSIARAHRDESPGSSFEPHVDVTPKDVYVWWGESTHDDASVRLRPIPRAELGL